MDAQNSVVMRSGDSRRVACSTWLTQMKNLTSLLALLCCVLMCEGCYVLHLAGGQLSLINDQKPLPAAVADEQDPVRRALLLEVQRVRQFAEGVVRLSKSDSYVGYYETSRGWLTLVLSAAPRDKLQPHTRWYPFAGRVPYRSFFDEARAQRAQQELENAGYDTFLAPSPAYSTLGAFRDPVTTPMLDRGPPCAPPQDPDALDGCKVAGLAETLIHELTHQHLYVPGQTTFNERLASFVGRTAAAQYLTQRGLYTSELKARLEQAFARQRLFEQEVESVARQLEAVYASPLSYEAKLARRQPLLDKLSARAAQLYPESDPAHWIMNNARVLQYRRYERGADDMQSMWKQAGGDWSRFWQLAAARADSL